MAKNKSIYQINRGVNCDVEVQGIKGKFLYYVIGVLMGSLLLFVILKTVFGSLLGFGVVVPLGLMAYTYISGISKKYGIHGMDKKFAKNRSSKVYQIPSRKIFLNLKKNSNEDK